MRRTTILMAAATLAIGSMTLPIGRAIAADPADPSSPRSPNTTSDPQRTGTATDSAAAAAAAQRGTKASATDERGIREELATIVDDATNRGKFRDLAHQFRPTSRSDRERAGRGARPGISGDASSNPQINDNANTNRASGTGTARTDTSTNQGAGRDANANPQINDNANTKTPAGTSTDSKTATDTNQGAGRDASARGASDRNDAGDTSDLDAKITQLQKDFKEKYNQDLSVRGKEDQVFTQSFAMINTGNFGDAARTAGERVPGSSGTSGSSKGDSGSGTSASGNATGTSGVGTGTADSGVGTSGARPAADRGDAAQEPEEYATVTIPANQGAQPVTLRLVSSSTQWKGQWYIDAPGSIDRQQLKANLVKHLDMVDQDKANWPSDVNDAYRAISHHVFMAISDTVSAGGGRSDSGANGSGRTGTGTGTGSDTSTPKSDSSSTPK